MAVKLEAWLVLHAPLRTRLMGFASGMRAAGPASARLAAGTAWTLDRDRRPIAAALRLPSPAARSFRLRHSLCTVPPAFDRARFAALFHRVCLRRRFHALVVFNLESYLTRNFF
jgi:hypothetical protein